jgi:hypothetical protein
MGSLQQGVAMLLDLETGRAPTTTVRSPARRQVRAWTGLVLASFLGACTPSAPEAEPGSGTGGKISGTGGSKASGGSGGGSASGGSGGNASGGSGGNASGGSTGTGGSKASGGAGGSATGGSTGTGGSKGDAAAPMADGPPGTFAALKDALSGCVFCHPGETDTPKNTTFSDPDKLRELLLAESKFIGATCPIKTLVVPGKPMESLLYIKVAGKPPAGCGERMPKGKTPDQWNTDVIYNWIMNGAPM